VSIVETPLGRSAGGGRVIWGGRWSASTSVGGARDGWNSDRTDLLAQLDGAAELVVLDALSFPWETMRPTDFDIPMVLALPATLDATAIEQVLGDVVLDRLTPHDVVVESREEVRRDLVARHGLVAARVVDPGGPDPEDVDRWIAARSLARLDEVETDLGVYRSQAGDLITRQLREFGAHQRGVLNMLLALVRPDDVIIDVGAHIGTLAIPLAQRLVDGHVLALEGHPATAAILAHNVAANGLDDRITVRNRLLGEVDGELLDPRLAEGNTGGTAFRRRLRAAGGEALTTARLDDVWDHEGLPPPTILKVDVEGAEMRVLRGAEAVLATSPILVLEVSEDQLAANGDRLEDLQTWLDDHGFRLLASAGERNHRSGDWELLPLASLRDHPDALFDVVAVPSDSSRVDDLGLRGTA